jgi:hypothetical protein
MGSCITGCQIWNAGRIKISASAIWHIQILIRLTGKQQKERGENLLNVLD